MVPDNTTTMASTTATVRDIQDFTNDIQLLLGSWLNSTNLGQYQPNSGCA